MTPPVWLYDDGGRDQAGYTGKTGDCVTRAIAIAAQMPYEVVCQMVDLAAKEERPGAAKRRKKDKKTGKAKRSSSQTGVWIPTVQRLLKRMGWTWTPTMFIGSGCKVHLRADELPPGRIIVNLSRHLAAVVDGVVYDLHDPTRGGTRCVYGYWSKEN